MARILGKYVVESGCSIDDLYTDAFIKLVRDLMQLGYSCSFFTVVKSQAIKILAKITQKMNSIHSTPINFYIRICRKSS